MGMFTLYTTPLSANGRKVLAVSHYLGLQPEVKLVNVYKGEGRTPEYLSINPWGKIPTLVDGELTLWESNAILLYLSEAHGGYRLWSQEPKQRADISRWLFWESAHWQPAFYVIPGLATLVGQRLGLPQAATSAPVTVDWGDERFQSLAKFLDAHLSGRAFLVGDALSLADFSVAGMMTYARPAGFPFDAFAHLGAWYARMESLPAWSATAVGPWR
jgi:glutathione S-transferase